MIAVYIYINGTSYQYIILFVAYHSKKSGRSTAIVDCTVRLTSCTNGNVAYGFDVPSSIVRLFHISFDLESTSVDVIIIYARCFNLFDHRRKQLLIATFRPTAPHCSAMQMSMFAPKLARSIFTSTFSPV